METPAEMHHPLNEEEKKFRKNVAKKTTDFAIDFITGPIGQIPGVRNKVQSLKNKKNRALGLGVDYKEAYVDADKNKYPTEESFIKAAKAYNKRKAAPEGPINMVTPVVDPSTGMPITPMQPSNTMGMAKPVFDNTATQAAAGVFGQMQAPGQLARVLPTPLNKYKK